MHLVLFQILTVLREAPADASAVLMRLEALTSGKAPSLPAFYRHLRRGVEEGWVVADGTVQDDGAGRPAQSYRLTLAGVDALRERARELEVFTGLALEGRRRGS